MANNDITLAILAGGKATRMNGVVKGLLNFNGQPLVTRIVERLKSLLPVSILVVDDCTAFTCLNLNCVCDKYEGLEGISAGLPGAILTALETCDTKWCFIVGSDMPFVSEEIANLLIEHAFKDAADVIIPMRNGYREPLFALYRKSGCTSSLQAMVKKGIHRVAKLYEKVQVLYVDIKEGDTDDPCDPFTNLNTSEDYERALRGPDYGE